MAGEHTKPRKLHRAVIKEELVALTGSYKLAVVLNQLIYWSERREDADKFLAEEKKRIRMQNKHVDDEKDKMIESFFEIANSHGWVYKKAEELATETMMKISAKTMLTYLDELVENGWLQKRQNPRYNFDRTYQYRVNLVKIQNDLHKLGYSLEGYDLGFGTPDSRNENEQNSGIGGSDISEIPKICNFQNVNGSGKNVNASVKNERAIPEITTEITTDILDDEGQQPKQEENEETIKQEYKAMFGNNLPKNVMPILLGLKNLDDVKRVFRILNDKQKNGKVKNPTGLLCKDPSGVISGILAGTFFPTEHKTGKINKEALPSEIQNFENYTGIIMIPGRLKIYGKWQEKWGFSSNVILKAAEQMCLRTTKSSMQYIDRVLADWHQKGLNTIEQVCQNLQKKSVQPKDKNYNSNEYPIYEPPQYCQN